MTGLVYNTDTLDPMLEALRDALDDPSEAMADLGEYLINSTQDRMLKGENPDGSPFAPAPKRQSTDTPNWAFPMARR
nr:phage virion morphogenesis protein [Leisingera sp. NJS201]